MTPRNYEIVDCGAFCEVFFFCISPKNLLGDFFDSLAINVLFSDHQKCLDLIFRCLSRLINFIGSSTSEAYLCRREVGVKLQEGLSWHCPSTQMLIRTNLTGQILCVNLCEKNFPKSTKTC